MCSVQIHLTRNARGTESKLFSSPSNVLPAVDLPGMKGPLPGEYSLTRSIKAAGERKAASKPSPLVNGLHFQIKQEFAFLLGDGISEMPKHNGFKLLAGDGGSRRYVYRIGSTLYVCLYFGPSVTYCIKIVFYFALEKSIVRLQKG